MTRQSSSGYTQDRCLLTCVWCSMQPEGLLDTPDFCRQACSVASSGISRPAGITCPAGAAVSATANSPGAARKRPGATRECPGAAADGTLVRLWHLLPDGWWGAAAGILLTLYMQLQRIPAASYYPCCLPAQPSSQCRSLSTSGCYADGKAK